MWATLKSSLLPINLRLLDIETHDHASPGSIVNITSVIGKRASWTLDSEHHMASPSSGSRNERLICLW
ncbi:hypothetical protein QCA50_013045 [Cerrena zonata]|uniref:Uncharacterized protein n=1 Tax=Cerrena zonata TaxID=2478898 RepID=A0AAW0FW95_9APHY